MPKSVDIYDLEGEYRGIEHAGIGGMIKNKIDGVVYGAGQSLWDIVKQAAPGGFFKGLLIATGIVLAAGALGIGSLAYSGNLELVPQIVTQYASYLGHPVQATFGQGLKAGLSMALNYLSSGFGLATLAIGGGLGAIADVRNAQNRLSASEAEIKAAQYDLRRAQGVERAMQPALPPEPQQEQKPQAAEKPAPNAPGMQVAASVLPAENGYGGRTSFVARELRQRQANASANLARET